MKLLVDCTPLAAGGGVQVAIAFLTKLTERPDVEWAVAAPEPIRAAIPPALAADPRVLFLAKSGPMDRVTMAARLSVLERELKPDVVFTVFGPAYFSAKAPHVVGFALPNLIYHREAPLPPLTAKDRLLDWLRCVSLRRADHLMVETRTVRHRLSARIGVPMERISVIENCVNPRLSRVEPAGASGKFQILVPSAYYAHKNLEIVPRVAAAIVRRSPALDFCFQFTLAADDPAWIRIVKDARAVGVEGHLETLGVLPIDDLSQAYANASAVFLPTLREASTAVYPESFFFERPLVTSDMDFAHDLCGDAALFIDASEPEAGADAILRLESSQNLREQLIEAGRARLRTSYPTADWKFERQMTVLDSVRVR